MTKKQFYTDGKYVVQDGKLYVICNGEYDADVVATALNELLDKNEELKELRDYFERKKYEYHNKWNLAHLDNINLRKENEQLKQSNQEAIELIYDGIVEMHDGKRDYAETLFNKAIEIIGD